MTYWKCTFHSFGGWQSRLRVLAVSDAWSETSSGSADCFLLTGFSKALSFCTHMLACGSSFKDTGDLKIYFYEVVFYLSYP